MSVASSTLTTHDFTLTPPLDAVKTKMCHDALREAYKIEDAVAGIAG